MKIILNQTGEKQDRKVLNHCLTGLEMMGKKDDVPGA